MAPICRYCINSAGKPYLIKWAEDSNIENPLFKNVTITASEGQSVGNADAQFVGILKPTSITGNTKMFVAAENKLYWYNNTDANSYLNSFRGYFNIAEGGSLNVNTNMPARLITSDPVATDIQDIMSDKDQTIKMIQNGQLIIIHNGVMYNAQGQMIQ